METNISVRPAVGGDVDVICEFNQRMARETEDLQLDAERLRAGVERLLADPGLGRYLVAECDGKVVGQVMHTYEWSDWRCGLFWWLQSVYVLPEYRSRGVFRRLFESLESQALATPEVCGLRLYVEQDNQAAQRTYLRMGMPGGHYQVHEKLLGPA